MKFSISNHLKLSWVGLVCLGGLAPLSAACSGASAGDRVGSHFEVLGQTTSGLSAASITSVTGRYGALCTGRSDAGSDTWTISGSGRASDELSVPKNDSTCVLTILNIHTAGGSFIGSPAIPLDAANAYQGSASAFALESGPLAFYANAKISALTFADNFTITILVSDAPGASDGGTVGAAFATQSASMSPSTVTAPNYTVGFSAFVVQKDASDLVASATGYAQLSAGSTTGQDYAVYVGALTGASTLSQVETAWGASSPAALTTLSFSQIPAARFSLVGADLTGTVQRTIILRNQVEGVSSYQLLLVTFVP